MLKFAAKILQKFEIRKYFGKKNLMTCIFIFFSEFYNPLHPFTCMCTHIAYLCFSTRLDVRLPMIFCNHRSLVVFCTFVKHNSKVEEQSSIFFCRRLTLLIPNAVKNKFFPFLASKICFFEKNALILHQLSFCERRKLYFCSV